jgi:hypothetical protein
MKLRRQSPVQFDAVVAEEAEHGDWQVVLAYEDENEGPWLVDLSHHKRWDFQDIDVGSKSPFGLQVPARPGQASVQHEFLITRMNSAQTAIWQLGQTETEAVTDDSAGAGMTDMTDAHCMLAVLGEGTLRVMEHLSNLDLFDPHRAMPFLTQGPVMGIPCQVVTLGAECVVMTLSRGYGQTFVGAMQRAASGCSLKPGGENRFNSWFRLNYRG